MKLSSISGVVYPVADVDRAAEFYEALGFRPGKRHADRATLYVNWFWVELVADDGRRSRGKPGSGSDLYVTVDSADEAHRELGSASLKPEGEPAAGAAGRREFALIDPDGYRLVFFEK
jgi:catechol 2,3-dioxygenase-like lactoylglutathione lyase family enzyme